MKPTSNLPAPRRAIIYCRVSSTRQREEGHGLESQEHRCRQYAALQGYEVEAVFPDDASGGGDFMRRPGMVALLTYLDAKPNERFAIIFDDLKRFARDREFHFGLKRALAQRGARPECLNFKFDDTPEGEFVETVFAAQGHLEREQNKRTVIQRMTACVEGGRYIFAPAVGYKYADVNGARTLVPDEPRASVVRECLEGYACGRFQSIAEVKRHMEGFACVKKNAKGEVYINTAREMLKRPLYAGLVRVPKWGPELHQGIHKPLVSVATWRRVQDRLGGKAYAPARKDLNADFPLRGAVACSNCGNNLTAAWAKGRSASYAYYWCQTKGCELHRKSIRKDKIEGEFEALLQGLRPMPALFEAGRAMLADLWQVRLEGAESRRKASRAELAAVERKLITVTDRLLEAESPAVIRTYERQLEKLEDERAGLRELSAKPGQQIGRFEDVYRTAIEFIANPWKIWSSEALDRKRMVLKLVFPDGLQYCPETGYRTAETPMIFRLFGASSAKGCEMVEPGGIEPPTS